MARRRKRQFGEIQELESRIPGRSILAGRPRPARATTVLRLHPPHPLSPTREPDPSAHNRVVTRPKHTRNHISPSPPTFPAPTCAYQLRKSGLRGTNEAASMRFSRHRVQQTPRLNAFFGREARSPQPGNDDLGRARYAVGTRVRVSHYARQGPFIVLDPLF